MLNVINIVQLHLQKLKPSNDLCESILCLNDYLTTAFPNMLQVTRSNLIEIKKNNTIKWYDSLPHEQKDKIRVKVMEEYRCNETSLSEQQQIKMKKKKKKNIKKL